MMSNHPQKQTAGESTRRAVPNNTKPEPFYNSKGKVVATRKGDTLYKTVKGSIHMLRRPPAWALDMAILNEAEKAGAVRVQVTDKETGTIYRATVGHIREAGITFNRGHGLQIALPLSGWTRHKRGAGLAPVQPSLFGGGEA
ncbi:MAG TPA: hypothetical protein PKX41_11970 [Anaerolineaceae bacterium]|nr:hypothetical protein [Anaerolineaceae bacterium]